MAVIVAPPLARAIALAGFFRLVKSAACGSAWPEVSDEAPPAAQQIAVFHAAP